MNNFYQNDYSIINYNGDMYYEFFFTLFKILQGKENNVGRGQTLQRKPQII